MAIEPRALAEIEAAIGKAAVLADANDLKLYEYDAGVDKALPDVVAFPRTTEDVVALVKLARAHNLAIVGRGAGTGLSGGAIARAGGMILSFARMNRILEIDIENERAVVQPGVVNLDITLAAQPFGYFYAPDPSSQRACTRDNKSRGES
jgi:glycolate oxidase